MGITGAKFSAACAVLEHQREIFKRKVAQMRKFVYWNTYYQNIAERKESIIHCGLALNYSSGKGYG